MNTIRAARWLAFGRRTDALHAIGTVDARGSFATWGADTATIHIRLVLVLHAVRTGWRNHTNAFAGERKAVLVASTIIAQRAAGAHAAAVHIRLVLISHTVATTRRAVTLHAVRALAIRGLATGRHQGAGRAIAATVHIRLPAIQHAVHTARRATSVFTAEPAAVSGDLAIVPGFASRAFAPTIHVGLITVSHAVIARGQSATPAGTDAAQAIRGCDASRALEAAAGAHATAVHIGLVSVENAVGTTWSGATIPFAQATFTLGAIHTLHATRATCTDARSPFFFAGSTDGPGQQVDAAPIDAEAPLAGSRLGALIIANALHRRHLGHGRVDACGSHQGSNPYPPCRVLPAHRPRRNPSRRIQKSHRRVAHR